MEICESGLKKLEGLFGLFCNCVYVLAALAMVTVALGLIISSLMKVYDAFSIVPVHQPALLDAVSLIVISIAIFDVARYVMEEEVLHDRELRDPKEAREAITKFMVIIALAVALEGIVFMFDLGKATPECLLYPILLLSVSVLMIVGLGWYQRLSLQTEKDLNGAYSPDSQDTDNTQAPVLSSAETRSELNF
jgi:hypothetical protein